MITPRHIALAALKPLSEAPVQTYFCAGVQLSDIIEWVISQTGQARLDISTFSAGEEFLRRLYMLRQKSDISYCRIICDTRAMNKTRLLSSFMRGVADEILVGSNHSKVVIVSADKLSAVIVTSQNLTRGNRYEAGIVSADPVTVDAVRMRFDELIKHSADVLGA